MSTTPSPDPWPLARREPGPDLQIFRTRFDFLEHPRSRAVMRRIVLETPDWVNVIALTPAEEVVMVRQYRFGTETVTLEIPGGMVGNGEPPEEAARRELAEETGFTAGRWTYLGSCEPNPAFHDNVCHHLLAEGARRAHAPRPDPGEDIVVETRPLRSLPGAVRSGEITHSLVIAALALVLDLRPPRG